MGGGSQSGEAVASELLTTAETARLGNMAQTTLRRWSRRGIAPAPVSIGGAVRRTRAFEATWVEQGITTASRESH